jgi:capsular exopolysaccharide synthesis family protein
VQERVIPKNLKIDPVAPQSGFISYDDVFRLVRQYFATIAFSIIATLAIIVGYVLVAEPVYRARTEIIIDPKMPQVLREQTGEISFSMDTAQVESQIAVLRSERIADTVVERLNLMSDPEFGPRRGGIVNFIHRQLGWHDPATGPDSELAKKRAAISAFENGLDVGRVGMSYAIEIYFSSNNPAKAAKIANAVTEAYVNDQLESKAQTSRQGSEWLEERIDQLRAQMNIASKKVQLYKASHDYRIIGRPTPELPNGSSAVAAPGGVANEAHPSNSHSTANAPQENSLEELESTAATYRRIYESYLQAFTESVQRQSFPVADARVITPATQPLTKSSPKTMILLAFGTMLGGLAGIGISFVRHVLDNTIRIPRQIRETIGVDCLGQVPCFSKPASFVFLQHTGPMLAGREKFKAYASSILANTRSDFRFDEVIKSPASTFTTGLASVQAAMKLSTWRSPLRTIGITSASEGDGKTTLAINLAALSAKSGLRVLVIDCNFHNPSLSNGFAPDVESGLVEVLADQTLLESSKIRIEMQGIDFLPVGNASPDAPAGRAINFESMRALLKNAVESYDLVLLDMPEIRTDFDALNIGALLDGVILTVTWGSTSTELLAEAAHMLRTSQSNIIGAIINKADASSPDSYLRQFQRFY